MIARGLPMALLLAAAACSPPPEPGRVISIIGATLVHRGGVAVEDAVVVVREGRVWAAGTRAETPIPAGSRKLDARGLYLAPESADDPVEPGRPANLLLLAGDPRAAGAARPRVERIMKDGEWVDPAPPE